MNKLLVTTVAIIASVIPAHANSLWDHNGSTMRMISNGTVRIIYDRVRPGLTGTIHSGDASFSGHIIGNRVIGNAFVYTKYCPGRAFPYQVSGTYYGDTIEIRGAAPAVDPNNCTIVSFSWNSGNAHRVYKLLAEPVIIPIPVAPVQPNVNNNNNNIIVVPSPPINNNIIINPVVQAPIAPVEPPQLVPAQPYQLTPPPPVDDDNPPPLAGGPEHEQPMRQIERREELKRQGREFCRQYPTDEVCSPEKPKGTKK